MSGARLPLDKATYCGHPVNEADVGKKSNHSGRTPISPVLIANWVGSCKELDQQLLGEGAAEQVAQPSLQ
jgi:hypothetical protein